MSDVAIHRNGLVRLLEEHEFHMVGNGPPGRSALADLAGLGPDIVLLDVTPALRTEEAARIREAAPEARIVALAVPEVANEVVRCAEAGIRGYVDPEASQDELVRIIESVAHGDAPSAPSITSALMARIEALSSAASAFGLEPELLTRREREIFELIAEGRSNREIAGHLQIEIPTVKTHVHHILAKMHLRRRGEIAAHALRAVARRTGAL